MNRAARSASWLRLVRTLGLAGLLVLGARGASAPSGPVQEVGAIGITVAELDREVAFFTNVLAFRLEGIDVAKPGAADAWLGLRGTQLRRATLRLGKERLRLTEHRRHPGRPLPPDSRSDDLWFQHVAIVVRDLDEAYARLRRHEVAHISTGPQTLPAWNRDAGGIRAFYFRDPEGHPLELIWFPPDKGDPRWQRTESSDRLFLGIDHTAIVVRDTARSLAFYRDRFGLRVAGTAENHGPEQEHLNQVFGARLRITALRAARGPGVELLEYLAPPGGRPLPADAAANDLWFWDTEFRVEMLEPATRAVTDGGGHLVSRRAVALPFGPTKSASMQTGPKVCGVIGRDPDGHALQLVQSAGSGEGPVATKPGSVRDSVSAAR